MVREDDVQGRAERAERREDLIDHLMTSAGWPADKAAECVDFAMVTYEAVVETFCQTIDKAIDTHNALTVLQGSGLVLLLLAEYAENKKNEYGIALAMAGVMAHPSEI